MCACRFALLVVVNRAQKSSHSLANQQLVESKLVRRPGASDLDWLEQLVD